MDNIKEKIKTLSDETISNMLNQRKNNNSSFKDFLIDEQKKRKKDYPLTDSEFMEIDDQLYIIIQKTLEIKYNINEDKHLNNWYCDIRDKLCQQIQNKKLELK